MISATHSNHPLAAVTPDSSASSPMTDALNRIRQAQMRITKPRVAILESLQTHEGPITIEQIHHEVGEDMCDLVTVYRCLTAFEEIGLVRRSYQHTGTCLYELTINTPRHYHIVCKSCRKTERVEYLSVENMERMLEDRGYTQLSHVIEFFGICPACQQAATVRSEPSAIPVLASC